MILNRVCYGGKGFISVFFDFVVPQCQFSSRHIPILVVSEYFSQPQGIIVYIFQIREFPEQDFRPFLLSFGPFAGCLEKQVPASGEQLSERVPIAEHLRFIEDTPCFGFPDGFVFILHDLPAVGYAQVLNGFIDQFGYMEAVNHLQGSWKASSHNFLHAVCHVKGDFLHHVPQFWVNEHEYLYHIFRLCTPDDGYNGSFSSFSVPVYQYGIKFSLAERSFIDAQMISDVLGIDDIIFRMGKLVPVVIGTQMILVLVLQLLAVQTVMVCNTLAANRMSV